MVLQLRAGHSLVVVGRMLSTLSAMSKTSAVVLAKCLLRAGSLPPVVSSFDTHCRASCSDKAGCNVKAEALIRELRGQRSCSFNLHCNIHVIATAMARTMTLMNEDVKGIFRTGLSLQVGAYMTQFRKAITEVVQDRVILCAGGLSTAAQAYKAHMLQLYHTSLTSKSKKLILFLAYLNGDWRNTEAIEYHVDKPGSLQDRAQVVRALSVVIIEVYASSRPPLYPRHRWTGADKSVDWVASFQSIHGLFKVVYLRFLALVGRAAPSAEPGVAAPTLPLAELPQELDREDPMSLDVGAGGTSGTTSSSAVDAGAREYATQLARDRRCGQEWLLTDPSTNLYVMRTVQQPLLDLLYSEFHVSSPEHELVEQAKAPRAFKLTECARQVHEIGFFNKLHTLFVDVQVWHQLPPVGKTSDWRCKIFRLLSRAGCLVQELYAHKHTLSTYCMFQLVHNPEVADELRNKPTFVTSGFGTEQGKFRVKM